MQITPSSPPIPMIPSLPLTRKQLVMNPPGISLKPGKFRSSFLSQVTRKPLKSLTGKRKAILPASRLSMKPCRILKQSAPSSFPAETMDCRNPSGSSTPEPQICSALQSRECNSFDQVLLRTDIQKDHRYQGADRSCHDQTVFRFV